jgi:hypothetical protein
MRPTAPFCGALVAALLGLALADRLDAQPDSSAACVDRPVAEDAPAPAVRPGAYRLTLVPTGRPARAGHAVTGSLWLWPARADDRSPRTGERTGGGPAARALLVGATDAPLGRAGVVLDRRDTAVFPPPTSRDPVYPGVVVYGAEVPPGSLATATLWVGTANSRAPQQVRVADGPGAVLRALRGTPGGVGSRGGSAPPAASGARGTTARRTSGRRRPGSRARAA